MHGWDRVEDRIKKKKIFENGKDPIAYIGKG
jgi:hypothetical protein